MILANASLTDKTFAGVLWQFVGTGAESALKALVLIVLARLLSPQDFGVVGAALIVISLTQIFSLLGVGPAIVQRSDLTAAHIHSAFGFSLLSGAFVGLMIWFLAPYVAVFFRMPDLTQTIRVLAFFFPLTAPGIVSEALLSRELKFRRLALIDILSFGLGYGAVGIALAVGGLGVWALVFGVLAQALLRTILLIWLCPHSWRLWGGRRPLLDVLDFGFGQALAQLGNFAANQADNLVVGKWMSAEALGLYGRAYQFLMLPANMFGRVVDKVLFPALATIQTDRERLGRAFVRSVGLVAMITLPMSALLVMLAPELVSILLGARWKNMIEPFQLLAAFLLFRTSYKMSDSLARATGAVYRRAWRQWVYAGMVFVGALIGTRFGLVGVSGFVGVAITLNFLLMMQLSIKLTGASARELLMVHVRHFCSALPPVICSALIVWLCRSGAMPNIVTVVAASAAWGSAFVAMLLLAPRLYGGEGAWIVDQAMRSLSRIFATRSKNQP